MLNFVTENRRTIWSTHIVKDDWRVNFLIALTQLTVSAEMLQLMLSTKEYRMFRYSADGKNFKIGYGYGDATGIGVTEAEAYGAWIEYIKDKETRFKTTLPLISMSQSHYDALFGLYCDTGTWKKVTSDVGTYDVFTAIKAGRWLLATDMIADGKVNPTQRKAEARVLQLADYTTSRTRQYLLSEGIAYALKQYTSGGITTELSKRQCESGYYRQTTAFIPGMTNLRQRELIAKFGQL
jgi:hypothetical protein